MQTLLKPEMLSDEVKKDLNLTPNVATIGQRSENETNTNIEQDASIRKTNENVE
jgi:hypothetical protein